VPGIVLDDSMQEPLILTGFRTI